MKVFLTVAVTLVCASIVFGAPSTPNPSFVDITNFKLFGVDVAADSPLTDQVQCLVDTLAQVSKDLGLDDLWNATQPDIQSHLDDWVKCSTLGNRFAIIFCNIKEGVQTYKLVVDYIGKATAENPEFPNRFVNDFRSKCAPALSVKSFNRDNTYNNIEHVKCIIDAINVAVSETDFDQIWKEYRAEMEKAFERMKECNTKPNKGEAFRCIADELVGAYNTFNKFINNLKDVNYELFARVKEYIEEKCHQ